MKQEESTLVREEIQAVLRKGAIQCISHQKWEFISNLFLVEERWCSQASNKPQKFEEIFAIPIFQDRGSTLSKGLVATEGLYRLEGCLLLRSTLQKLPEVYMFSMRRELVLNSMSLL